MKNTPEARQADILNALSVLDNTLEMAHKEVRTTRVTFDLSKANEETKRLMVRHQIRQLKHFQLEFEDGCETLEALIKKENEE